MTFCLILVIGFHLSKQHGTSYGYRLINVQVIVKRKLLQSTSRCKHELFKLFTKSTYTWQKKLKSLTTKLTPNLFLNILALFSKKQIVPQIVWEQRCYSPILLHLCRSAVSRFQECGTPSTNCLPVSQVTASYKQSPRKICPLSIVNLSVLHLGIKSH